MAIHIGLLPTFIVGLAMFVAVLIGVTVVEFELAAWALTGVVTASLRPC
jgi:hypothetical protein